MKNKVDGDLSLRVIVSTILAMKLKGYYELSDLSSIAQFFPFDYEITHEWIYSTGYFDLTNFAEKLYLWTKRSTYGTISGNRQ